jgi:transcriptional regulator with XRE-family HTH domain
MGEPVGLGANIRKLRKPRLSQAELAKRAGVDLSVVCRLEQGRAHSARVETLQKIARALDVSLRDLFDTPSSAPSANPDAGVVAIRRALTPVDDLLDDDVVDTAPLQLVEAERIVNSLWDEYWAGRYELLSELLPSALIQLRATVRAVPTAQRQQASHALALAYKVAGDTLIHLGHQDAAFLAIREALRAASNSDDELLDAALRISVAWQLLVQGRYEESERVAVVAAKNIEPTGHVPEAQLSAYGLLTVTAATSAARAGRAATASDLLEVSREMAGRLGRERADHQTTFGPAKVAMMAVDCAVVQDDFAGALQAAKSLPRDAELPLAARARHMADLALSYLRLGMNPRALQVLTSMDQAAPDWIKYQSLPAQIVEELLDRQRRVSPPLRDLAKKLGVNIR